MTAALSAAKDLAEVRQNKEPPCASDKGFEFFCITSRVTRNTKLKAGIEFYEY